MKIVQVKCFWEVMKTKSFTKAAERLYLTQSSVSKYISALEEEMGFLLFERRGRTVQLSPEGKEMLKNFSEILSAYERTMGDAEKIRASRFTNGAARIIMVPAVEKLGIISKITQFADLNPMFNPIIEVMDENQVIMSLEAGYCDMAFCSNRMIDESLYQMEKYSTNHFNLIISNSHAKAKWDALWLRDLVSENLILMSPESMLYDLCVEACEEAGFTPNVAHTTSRPDTAMEYVMSSNCIYMAIEFEMKNDLPGSCKKLELLDSPKFDYVFAWRKDNNISRLLKEFVEYIKQEKELCI